MLLTYVIGVMAGIGLWTSIGFVLDVIEDTREAIVMRAAQLRAKKEEN
jgi:hypothetical protein